MWQLSVCVVCACCLCECALACVVYLSLVTISDIICCCSVHSVGLCLSHNDWLLAHSQFIAPRLDPIQPNGMTDPFVCVLVCLYGRKRDNSEKSREDSDYRTFEMHR